MVSTVAIPHSPAAATIRVLVVDDSAFMRYTISQHLAGIAPIQVVGTARDGEEALAQIPKLQPDVITLDVEMPRLDGLSTLRQIMARFPRPVIMLSSLTQAGAVETIQALTIGAVDFVGKPEQKSNVAGVLDELAAKIVRAAGSRVQVAQRPVPVRPLPIASTGSEKALHPLQKHQRVVVIGASTGGPRALAEVVPALPGDLPAAVVIVQHMPAGFTHSLAERLDTLSQIRVKEAQPGDMLQVGQALLAPGGFHMVFDDNGQVVLNQNPSVHGVRPAVDVTLASVVRLVGARTISVILTGMGSDGANGSVLTHTAGGWVIAEDESTCVVWGMPRTVAESGAADQIAPLPKVAAAITIVARAAVTG